MNTNLQRNTVETSRLRQSYYVYGGSGTETMVCIHGNFSSSAFFKPLFEHMPSDVQLIAPDLRGYGDTEAIAVDATRGVRDYSDDLHALFQALDIKKAHVLGWSLGGGVAMQFAVDYPDCVQSLSLINPISPFGFGGTQGVTGDMSHSDGAGTGGAAVNPEFITRITEGDRGVDSPHSPRNIINTYYYKPPFRADDEEMFLSEALKQRTGDAHYPGDSTASPHWPTFAPGSKGPLNAISPKYFDVSTIVDLPSKKPILWIRGDADNIVSDQSLFDMGTLGKLNAIPGWPGDDVYPPQPMVSQTRHVLEHYRMHGGHFEEVVVADTAHSPHVEKPKEIAALLDTFMRR